MTLGIKFKTGNHPNYLGNNVCWKNEYIIVLNLSYVVFLNLHFLGGESLLL